MTNAQSVMSEVAEACIKCRCGCCKDECPMYSEILEETISPKGRNMLAHALLTGVLEPDDRTLRIAYSCLLCKRDEHSCSARLKNAEATEALREHLISLGAPLLPEHKLLCKSLENYGNPWQEPRSSRKRWAKGVGNRKVVPGKTNTIFYVGCTFSLDRTLSEAPRALAHLLECAGEDYGLFLDEELCCGSTVKRLGYRELFERLRAENERRLREAGVRRIVTACAGCYKTLKQDYGDLSRAVQVLHSTEYLRELTETGRLKFRSTDLKVTYHDPCHLGRHTEVYEAPRALLRSIPSLRLVEMEHSREVARCCGGGAGVKTAYPDIALRAAVRRMKEAERAGASALITACPFCVQSLQGAARSIGSGVEVVELSSFLDRYVECDKGAGP